MVLRKDPRGTGECASPWGGRRVGLGGVSAADWNKGGALLPTGAPGLLVGAGPQVAERLFPAFGNGSRSGAAEPSYPIPRLAVKGTPGRDWVMLGEVVDGLVMRLLAENGQPQSGLSK